ncbi:MAG TPA: MarR family transcriptional regulator [Candidatus Angelobacter sp.]
MAKLNKIRLSQIEDLADRLHSAAIHLLRQVRAEDAATGIAPARLSALSVLVFGGAMSLNDLARAEQVRPPTMSRIVDALESAGLARRTVNPQDRRAIVIEATQKGTAILWQGRKRRVKFLAKRLSHLSEAERKQIESAVQAIQKAMAK